jgi:hypothetical protein
MVRSCLGAEFMRFSTVDEDASRVDLSGEAAVASKVQESVAIHAALGPIAIDMRLKELNREIAVRQAGRESQVALLLGAFGLDGPTSHRRFLFSTAGAGLLAWFAAPRWPDMLRPQQQREKHGTPALQQEREALFKLKHELS